MAALGMLGGLQLVAAIDLYPLGKFLMEAQSAWAPC